MSCIIDSLSKLRELKLFGIEFVESLTLLHGIRERSLSHQEEPLPGVRACVCVCVCVCVFSVVFWWLCMSACWSVFRGVSADKHTCRELRYD